MSDTMNRRNTLELIKNHCRAKRSIPPLTDSPAFLTERNSLLKSAITFLRFEESDASNDLAPPASHGSSIVAAIRVNAGKIEEKLSSRNG
jgi:hypothetical protein